MSTSGEAGPVEFPTIAVSQWQFPPAPLDPAAIGAPGAVAVIGQRPAGVPELAIRAAGGWVPIARAVGEATDVDVHEVSWESTDGLVINGLLVAGAGTAPRSLVVHVHGGPANLWHRGLTYGTLALVAAGHAVLLPNPRGSVGRGQDYARANLEDPAGLELSDLITGVDHYLRRCPEAEGRVAFVGGSYGGYLTACAATTTGRAAAAAMISGHPDLVSARHGSNNGFFYDRLLGAPPYGIEMAATYLRRSPIVHVTPNTAPTLILHGADDRCTPVAQAVEFHTALSDAGVPTQLVVYPREGHGISEPDHQVDLWSRVCSWFDRFLPS